MSKSQGLGLLLTIPALGSQRHADPGASWPASLAYFTGSKPMRSPSQKQARCMTDLPPHLCAPICTHMCLSTRKHHVCAYPYTYKNRLINSRILTGKRSLNMESFHLSKMGKHSVKVGQLRYSSAFLHHGGQIGLM